MEKEIDLYEEILGESGQIKQIPVSELYDFKNHPFQVFKSKKIRIFQSCLKVFERMEF